MVSVGRTANLATPKPCQKFINHGPRDEWGCRPERDCPGYHQVLCRTSVQKQECLNRDCRFTHIKEAKQQQPATYSSTASDKDCSRPTTSAAVSQHSSNVALNWNFLEMFNNPRTHNCKHSQGCGGSRICTVKT